MAGAARHLAPGGSLLLELAPAQARAVAGWMREAGFGIKAATITPEGADDVGSPNRILREDVGGRVIIRTGRRIPGVTPVAGVHHPISIVRMAVEDAYGAEQWREGDAGEKGTTVGSGPTRGRPVGHRGGDGTGISSCRGPPERKSPGANRRGFGFLSGLTGCA